MGKVNGKSIGLQTIEDNLQTVDDNVDDIETATKYTESNPTGTTVDAYVTILDLDARGIKNITMILENTGGVNSLDYKVLVRYANYTSGSDEEDVAETALVAGDSALLQYTYAYSRIQVQVKATAAGNQTTYSLEMVSNK